jgi:hypothetical protein
MLTNSHFHWMAVAVDNTVCEYAHFDEMLAILFLLELYSMLK